MKLYYYSAPLRDPDPGKQEDNLQRAIFAMNEWKCSFSRQGIALWAPWIALALVEASEERVAPVIQVALTASDGIVLDMNGRSEPTAGMVAERDEMIRQGKPVRVLP